MTTVFCLDFDETLSNTDRLRADLVGHMRGMGGESLATAYEEAYEAVRAEHGAVSMSRVLQATSERAGGGRELHRRLAELLHTFSYQEYLYPGAEDTIHQLKKEGEVVILSDGDAFFQPQKIYATSVAQLVDGIVIVPHKVDRFAELTGYWPADRYVFIDDKQRVLDAAKQYFGERATTVLVQQGRYAADATPTADICVPSIAAVADVLLTS